MIFVRIVVSHTRDRVNAVMTQDQPFERGMVKAEGEECEIFDLGVVEDHDWRDRDGNACSPHRHLLDRLEDGGFSAAALKAQRIGARVERLGSHPLAAVLGVRRILDCPCSIATLKDRLRARGPDGLPITVRAWLANILPSDQVAEFGIGRGVPISARKSAELLRNKRDPLSGSQIPRLEAMVLRQERAREEKAVREHQAAESAWQEMLRLIEANHGNAPL